VFLSRCCEWPVGLIWSMRCERKGVFDVRMAGWQAPWLVSDDGVFFMTLKRPLHVSHFCDISLVTWPLAKLSLWVLSSDSWSTLSLFVHEMNRLGFSFSKWCLLLRHVSRWELSFFFKLGLDTRINVAFLVQFSFGHLRKAKPHWYTPKRSSFRSKDSLCPLQTPLIVHAMGYRGILSNGIYGSNLWIALRQPGVVPRNLSLT